MALNQAWKILLFSGISALWNPSEAGAQSITIPAFTAYSNPDSDAIRFSEKGGATRWSDPEQKVAWYGKFEGSGVVEVEVTMRLERDSASPFQMVVGEQMGEGIFVDEVEGVSRYRFGSFSIPVEGFQRFELRSLQKGVKSIAVVESLVLHGRTAESAKFNLKERRNAASVHLAFQVPSGTAVSAFYNEVTAIEDPVHTFYMACGWHRGYFGMQVNSPTERRIIFSVWDSGNEGVDRNKVDDVNRVKLIGKGEGVYSGDFGNEGTGGHSHLKYLWKTGEKQRFVVTAESVEETFTIFSGYWYHPDQQKWMLISAWKAPKEGGLLRGLHGFSENFAGSNGNLLRKARFGNQWIQTKEGDWKELTTASFSHDATGKEDRLDRYMGVEAGEFFLSHGGFVEGRTSFGEKFDRAPLGIPPRLELPK